MSRPNLATVLLEALGLGNLSIRRMSIEFDVDLPNGILNLEVIPMRDGRPTVLDGEVVSEIRRYRVERIEE